MDKVRWGIVGPGAIAHNFADGLAAAPNAELVAVSGRDAGRLADFADKYAVAADGRHGDAELLFAASGVDAVYISTPHPFHAQLTLDALRAGKHVLCEKPAGLNLAEVRAMVDCARDTGLFFMEAYMYRFHPQIGRLVELVAAGTLGTVRHIDASFCFSAPFDADSRAYNFELAGGAILDVGGYPVSFARLVAGAVAGKAFADPLKVAGVARKAATGVDEVAYALLEFADGITARCETAVALDRPQHAAVHGDKGRISLPEPWAPGRNEGPANTELRIEIDGKEEVERFEYPHIIFALEAQAASQAILAGSQEVERMSWADSLGNAAALQAWRDEVGYELAQERGTTSRRLHKVVPAAANCMSYAEVPGVKVPVSKLGMGCDNQMRASDGAVIWDAWLEAGGNLFDTAWLYGMGTMERLLGEWMKARGVRDEVAIIVKGATVPYCHPFNLRLQLRESLERLQTDRADIYIMHRDNPAVPVGEFVDVMSEYVDAGVIGAFGGSNWTLERFIEANEWADANGKHRMTVLNNNLALAPMVVSVWEDCVTSNAAKFLAYLRETNTVHVSWSSQARGFFLPAHLRDRLPTEEGPDHCFGSDDNFERRRRAEQLAEEKGVLPTNIAAAWVIGQTFPSIALVGPRSPYEITTTMPSANVELSAAELAWLNLEADER